MDAILTAMVTPMHADLSVDYDGVTSLAAHLAEHGSDGVVVNGTTGEAQTTSDAEKSRIVSAARAGLPGDAAVWAGVGTPSTSHSIELAREAEAAGATGLLVVSPFFLRPTQSGVISYYEAIADSTDLPVMLYDIPARSSFALDTDTIVRLAAHPKITALKDAKHNFEATSWVRARCDIDIYAGDDADLLALLTLGARGVVSVSSHIVGTPMANLVHAYEAGDTERALAIHLSLLPIYTGLFQAPNPTLVKACLEILGLPAGPLRSPFQEATPTQIGELRTLMASSGLLEPATSP